jgi:Transposase DDE domain
VHCRANEAYEAYRARGVMKDGRRFGKPPTPYTPPRTPQGKVNVTDPDSRNVKTPRGYMQGYNAQAVCNEHQIVVAAEINTDSPDFGHLEPMVTAAERELTAAGASEKPRVVVADAGYWHHDQMDELAGRGIIVLVPPDAGKRKGARPGWDGGRYASCAKCSQPTAAGNATANGRRRSSRSLPTPSSTGGSIASYAAA